MNIVHGDAIDVHDLPVGTDLPKGPDGAPRYVCACHLARSRAARGRGVGRLIWSGVLVPLVGLALIALDVAVLVKAEPIGAKAVCGGLLLLLAAGCLAGGRSGGHRGWCALRTAAYWFVAFPAVLLGALSAL